MTRVASLDDLPWLVRLEADSFAYDVISRRSFYRFITEGRAVLLIDEADGGIRRGYVLCLFRSKSTAVRIYSIAIDPAFRGLGVGRALIREGEQWALNRGCRRVRLEVRIDNAASLQLFTSLGYQCVARLHAYYDDGGDAFRLERQLP